MRGVFSLQLLLLRLSLDLARQDVGVRAGSSFAAVGAVADDVVGRGFARLEILIGMAPGIGGDGFDEIGDEDFEAVLGVGEFAFLQVIGVESGAVGGDVG